MTTHTDDGMASIKKVWDDNALASLPEPAITHRDIHQRSLEIELILRYLPNDQTVLDVGCGNGYSTAIFAKHTKSILGIDYSANMIERARRNYGNVPNADFRLANLLSLDLPARSFDTVISQRCLINLGTWENQKTALRSLAQVLKPGGWLLLQEGTQQGRARLNDVRTSLGLKAMPKVEHNLDFDETSLWPFLREDFELVEVRRLGLYDLIARVVHPLLVHPDEPDYEARINEIASLVAAKLPGMDDLSREFTAVLRRLQN